MGLADLQTWLTELPVIGPLFAGSVVAILLRVAGLIVAVVVGLRLLRWAWVRPGAHEAPVESERELASQGRREQAGDVAARKGNLEAALEHYKAAGAWVKAGHTARRLGQPKVAGTLFEKGGEVKLAIAALDAAGEETEVARLAASSTDPSLLDRAGRWYEADGDFVKAGRLMAKAGRLRDAERCFLRAGAEGRGHAINMYVDAFEERTGAEGRSPAVRDLALRAARLMHQAGELSRAAKLCASAGIDPRVLDGDPGASGGGRRGEGLAVVGSGARLQSAGASSRPSAPQASREDLAIAAPMESLDIEPVAAVISPPSPAPPAARGQQKPRAAAVSAARDDAGAGVAAKKPRPRTQDVAEALLAVLEGEESEGAPGTGPAAAAMAILPTELLREVSDEAVTMDLPSQSESVPSAAALATDTSVKFSSDVTDRYSILGEIGAGGMGEVYRAKDLSLGREVALKFLSATMVGDEHAMRLFLREARAAAALNHPAIVTVYDIGVLGGRPFICMEYIEGVDLATRLHDHGPIDVGEALGLTVRLAQALDYAHERSVVHRDIKPSNVIQSSDGGIKILDFGLAKVMQRDQGRTTFVAGTPEYMSPEQLAGREVDGRSDIFSVGVLLYEILTNTLPFEGALRAAVVVPPSARAAWLPAPLDDVVCKALALEPADRFQRARDLVAALQRLPRTA
jgi:hypothetical protein